MKNIWRDHPACDTGCGLVVAPVLYLHTIQPIPILCAVVSIVSAITLCIATLICHSFYTCSASLIVDMRNNHARQLRKTWMYIFVELELVSVLSAVLLMTKYGTVVSIGGLVIVLLAMLRVMDLYNVTLKAWNT